VSCAIPILIIGFIRRDQIIQCISSLKKVEPKNIYLAFDGPRSKSEESVIEEVRTSAINAITWASEVRTLYSERNRGCKDFPITAISWFFEQVDHGIILEDDILLDARFMQFVGGVKEFTSSHDINIGIVSACSYVSLDSKRVDKARKKRVSASLTIVPNIWGWYAESNVWEGFKEYQLKANMNARSSFLRMYPKINMRQALLFSLCLRMINEGKLNTWDYLFAEYLIASNLYTVHPSISFSHNIGYDHGATHTDEKEASPTLGIFHGEIDIDIDDIKKDRSYQNRLALNTPWKREFYYHVAKGLIKLLMEKLFNYRGTRR
jgi:hypothetical protein